MAKFVGLADETSYKTLVSNVVSAFNVEENKTKQSLSYLYETETTAFTQGKMPHVSISCDVGLHHFRKSRLGEKDLSLMLTLKSSVSGVGKSMGEGHVNVHETWDTISDDLLVVHMEKVEAEFMAKRIVEKSNKGKVVDNRASPQRSLYDEMGGSVEEEYDCDKWTDLINKDYPPYWDPFEEANRQRLKRNIVEGETFVCDVHSCGQHSGASSYGTISIPTMKLVVANDGHENGACDIINNFSPLGFSLGVEESLTNGTWMMDVLNEGEETILGQDNDDVGKRVCEVDMRVDEVDKVGDVFVRPLSPVLLIGEGSGIKDIRTLNVIIQYRLSH